MGRYTEVGLVIKIADKPKSPYLILSQKTNLNMSLVKHKRKSGTEDQSFSCLYPTNSPIFHANSGILGHHFQSY
uniref:Uncharacterized protein n=1 Tax=Anguilla anguilla TaxID=7936 RepID=A0A0E9U9J1_ANGAN